MVADEEQISEVSASSAAVAEILQHEGQFKGTKLFGENVPKEETQAPEIDFLQTDSETDEEADYPSASENEDNPQSGDGEPHDKDDESSSMPDDDVLQERMIRMIPKGSNDNTDNEEEQEESKTNDNDNTANEEEQKELKTNEIADNKEEQEELKNQFENIFNVSRLKSKWYLP